MEIWYINLKRANKYLIFFASLFIINQFSSCKSNEDAVISGNLKDSGSYLEGKMLYLGNVETKNFEDSCAVTNGRFKFHIKANKDFVPFRASIVYGTGNSSFPYQLVGYKNPFIKKCTESIFYVERGTANLEKDTIMKINGSEKMAFNFTKINKQTEVSFKHLTFKSDLENSQKIKDYNRSLINKYPYSLELLQLLNINKAIFEEQEVSHLLSLFDPSIQNTTTYKSLTGFVKYENKSGTAFPSDVLFKKPDNSLTSNAFNSKFNYNLVVFWASWCGPCRKEIPQIKKLYAKHKDELNIISISVDKREDWWKKALEKENMPWNQFLVRDSSFVKLDKKYNLQTIPVWLLFDSENKLIDKQIGINDGDDSIDQKVAAHISKSL